MSKLAVYLPLIVGALVLSLLCSRLGFSETPEFMQVSFYSKTNTCYTILTLLLILQIVFGTRNRN